MGEAQALKRGKDRVYEVPGPVSGKCVFAPSSTQDPPSAMKLAAAFLGLCVVLLSNSADAFFYGKSVDSTKAVPAVEAGTGVMAKPFLKYFNPLKFILASLGIPVGELMESSQKCIAELGPEAMGVMKTLLAALTYFG